MKKMYKYILIITLMMFSFIGDVKADDFKTLCTYESTDDGETLKIGYMLDEVVDYYSIYKNDKFEQYINGSYTTERHKKVVEQLKSNICPKSINYFDVNLFAGIPNYCLDDGDNACANAYPDYTIAWTKKLVTNNMEAVKGIAPNLVYNECVNDGTCTIACSYVDGQLPDNKYAFIYAKDGGLQFSFSWDSDPTELHSPNDSTVFIDPTALTLYAESAQCPSYVYVDENYEKEICFDNDGEYCKEAGVGNHFEDEDEQNETDVESNLTQEEVQNLVTKYKSYNLSCEGAYNKILEHDSSVSGAKQLCVYNNGNEYGIAYQFFIVNTGTEYKYYNYTKTSLQEIFNQVDEVGDIEFKFECRTVTEVFQYVSSNISDGSLVENKFSVKNNNLLFLKPLAGIKTDKYKYVYNCHYPIVQDSSIVDYDPENCQNLIGADFVEEINSYMLYIKVAVPILIIVLGSIDFGKAFIASDEDAMKKAQKHFIMRLIIGMVIFFIPSILTALMNLANQVWGIFGDTCGITF